MPSATHAFSISALAIASALAVTVSADLGAQGRHIDRATVVVFDRSPAVTMRDPADSTRSIPMPGSQPARLRLPLDSLNVEVVHAGEDFTYLSAGTEVIWTPHPPKGQSAYLFLERLGTVRRAYLGTLPDSVIVQAVRAWQLPEARRIRLTLPPGKSP